MKIEKSEFDLLYTDTISKKEYDAIIKKIQKRFEEIVITVRPKITCGGWFDYGNCGRDDDTTPGDFDTDKYKEYITIGGDNGGLDEPYENQFPTRWLWEDGYLEEYKSTVEEHKKKLEQEAILRKEKSKERRIKEKDKAIRRAELYRQMTTQIFAKLTDEEKSWLRGHIKY